VAEIRSARRSPKRKGKDAVERGSKAGLVMVPMISFRRQRVAAH
jgi:hypothetical protein